MPTKKICSAKENKIICSYLTGPTTLHKTLHDQIKEVIIQTLCSILHPSVLSFSLYFILLFEIMKWLFANLVNKSRMVIVWSPFAPYPSRLVSPGKYIFIFEEFPLWINIVLLNFYCFHTIGACRSKCNAISQTSDSYQISYDVVKWEMSWLPMGMNEALAIEWTWIHKQN